MIKLIIFDLDGTLLNTLGDIHYTLNESLKKFNLPEITLSDARRFIGNGAKILVQKAVGERKDLADNVYKYYSGIFAKCTNERTTLYDGAAEVLTKLHSSGIKLAIVTNKPQDATCAVYAKYLSKFGFCEVLGQTEYYPLKPNPASTLAILGKYDIKASECVFVGDGETDIETARAAGIRCISALWGYRSAEQLKAAGATEFASDFYELGEKLFI